MPWTYTISTITEDEQSLFIFGQLSFAGSYSSGGDTGSFGIGGNALGLPDWRPSCSGLHAALPPIAANIHLDGGYNGVLVPAGASAGNFKIKIVDPATHAELGNAAYPSSLAPSSGVAYHTMALRYRKNL